MKKVFLLSLLGLFLITSLTESADLKGRFGIGVNWPGVQARYGITDNILVEGRAQFASNNTTVGGRGYYLFTEIPGTIPILPYAGASFDWVISDVLKGGYLTGGFAGVELMLNKNIGVGGDAGLYWADIWYTEHYADWGVIFNAGLTYYF